MRIIMATSAKREGAPIHALDPDLASALASALALLAAVAAGLIATAFGRRQGPPGSMSC